LVNTKLEEGLRTWTRRMPTEFSVTVSATSVEIPFTLSLRICSFLGG
jgi:hypothetical protein